MVTARRRHQADSHADARAGLDPPHAVVAHAHVCGLVDRLVAPPDPNAAAGGSRPWAWWWGPWYVHDNLRDERAEAFAYSLGAGVYEYTYVARATTPGRFVVPPPKAEEMYAPETFGRGASAQVIVE